MAFLILFGQLISLFKNFYHVLIKKVNEIILSKSPMTRFPLFLTGELQNEILLALLFIMLLYKFRFYVRLYYKEFLVICIVALISFLAPSFQYFCMLLISASLLILSTSIFDSILPQRPIIVRQLFLLLNYLGIIFYFENVYKKYFFQNKKAFNIQTCLIYFNCICYVLISKYLFLNRFNINQFSFHWSFVLYFFLVINLFFVYVRILLNTSIIIHNLIPYYLTFDELQSDKNTPSTTSVNPPSNTSHTGNSYSFFNFSRYYNTAENAEHAAQQSVRFKRVGLVVGIATLGIGSYAAYQQHLQTIAALESVRLQEINNREMMRQNDLEEVSQKIMSEETYRSKWGTK